MRTRLRRVCGAWARARARSRARSRRSGIADAAAIGLIAVVVAACGSRPVTKRSSSLPPAGSTADDGSGLIASASSELASVSGSVVSDSEVSGERPSTESGGDAASRDKGSGKYAGYSFEQRPVQSTQIGPHGAYVVDTTVATGRIDGRVSWRRTPKPRVVTDASCGLPQTEVPVDAIVLLSTVARGRGFPTIEGYPTRFMQVGGVFSITRCGIVPRTQVVGPLGAVVRGQQLRQGATSITVSANGQTESELAMSWSGLGDTRIGRVRDSGPTEIKTDKGERGWLYVANHPFHVGVTF